MSKLKRLTFTFNRATIKTGESFEVMMPSSEAGGLEWVLHDPSGQLKTVASTAQPAWEPRSRTLTLQATGKGTIHFEMALQKRGGARPKQAYKFKVIVK